MHIARLESPLRRSVKYDLLLVSYLMVEKLAEKFAFPADRRFNLGEQVKIYFSLVFTTFCFVVFDFLLLCWCCYPFTDLQVEVITYF